MTELKSPSDKDLWEASCITRVQLASWPDSSLSDHAVGVRVSLQFLFDWIAKATTPRPIAEYHEDMGPVLWWKLEETSEIRGGELCIDRKWAGEPPYVGGPNDLGITVEAHVRLISQMDQEHEPGIVRRTLGGWPGYHTHFTPIPLPMVPK